MAISTVCEEVVDMKHQHAVAVCRFLPWHGDCMRMASSETISIAEIASVRNIDSSFFNFSFLPLYVPFSNQNRTGLLRIVKPGFVRYGNKNHQSGLACVLSNAGASRKTMFVGRHHAGEQWTDLLGWNQEVIIIDGSGWATFPVSTRSVSVWVSAAADDRDRFRLL
jgi:hypothetical protein